MDDAMKDYYLDKDEKKISELRSESEKIDKILISNSEENLLDD